jgi:hypothetical protein
VRIREGSDNSIVFISLPSVRWVQSAARLAVLAAALLLAANDMDVLPAAGADSNNAAATFHSTIIANWWLRHVTTAQFLPLYPDGSLTEFFNRGDWLGGFAAGFLGSGVLGLLFGRGALGGLGGVASYFGLALQLVLLSGLGWLIFTRWRTGNVRGAAARSPRELADAYLRSRDDLHAGLDSSPMGDMARKDAADQRRSSVPDEHR